MSSDPLPRLPPLPLPLPLLRSDGGFTEHTLRARLPEILRETCRAAAAPAALAQAVEATLCAPLQAGALLPPPALDALGLWAPATPTVPNSDPRSFWWQENVAYRHLLALWEAHGLGGADPFQAQKAQALEAARPAFLAGLEQPAAAAASAALHAALLRSLWGNRADLSLSAGKVVDIEGGEQGAALLLADDAAAAVALLLEAPSICIVLDNCGAELLQDLRLVDALLALRSAPVVTLHAKAWPTFVSDATEADVHAHMAWLGSSSSSTPSALALQARLQGALATGRLRITSHAFWNSARPLWGLPQDLRQWLRGSVALAVFKGDANYRRILGDLHWPHAQPFQAVVGAYAPCAVLALRTCKCGLAVGIGAEEEARAAASDPQGWLTSGQFGLIQLALPAAPGLAPSASPHATALE